jgi:dUTPase
VQFILVPILIEQFEQVEVEELFQNDSERSTGAFGSTGKA